ncbi:MAG: Nucleotidyltransferase substrate binding protein like [Spirosoma sp.]|nr:Nucleotidyltransferase substrate binding protein like [Spirosoma sp.]
MLENRNELNHTYDEVKSRQILDRVVQDYLPLLEKLEHTLTLLANKQ